MHTQSEMEWGRATGHAPQRVTVLGAVLIVLTLALALVMPSGQGVRASSLTVTTCTDDGSISGSLRNLIASAAGSTIVFGVDCPSASPLTLTSNTPLTLSHDVTIDGTGHTIVIDGNNGTDVFEVYSGVTVNLTALTIQHGNYSFGPIFNAGTLTVTNSTFSNNVGGAGGGGAINNYGGTLNVTNSTFTGNSSAAGGAIDTDRGGTLTMTNSTIAGNTSTAYGGAIYLGTGTATVTNSTISGNSATGATSYGGGVFMTVGTFNATNTLIVNNSATLGNDVVGTINGSHNLTGAFTFANGATIPSDNGGPTATLAIPTPAMPTGTDAYQQGDLTTCQNLTYAGTATPLAYDQRGANRVVNGTCSIGAFEPGGVNTTTALSTSSSGGPFGTSVTFTAAVAGVLGGTPPDAPNAVTFKNGSTTLGTANLTSGSATFTTTALPPSNSVTATYGGGTNYAASGASNVVMVPITKATPTVTATGNSAMNTSNVGQSVTFTATVTGMMGTKPTGTVTFTSGGMTLGSGAATLNGSGVATVTTSSLPAGRGTITATYSGDMNYLAGTPGAVTQLVVATSVPVQPMAHTAGMTSGTPAVQPKRLPTASPSGMPAVQPARH